MQKPERKREALSLMRVKSGELNVEREQENEVSDASIDEVLRFWFEELQPKQHWVKDSALDNEIQQRFGELHKQACEGKLSTWRETPRGRLAELIVLDQFSRNIFRDKPESFAADALACALTREAIELGDDQKLPVKQRCFIYMPLMHSEALNDHALALDVFDQPGLESNLDFEKRHLQIIERFGRYPHRNSILGRVSTEDEEAFLKQPGSSF